MKSKHEDFIGIYSDVISSTECNEFVSTIETFLKNSSDYIYGGLQFNTELGRHDYSINGLRDLPYESRIKF